MAECEAGSDSAIEAFVLFPNETERELVDVKIMDINGRDYTVAQVKIQLLQERGIDPNPYHLAFRNEGNEIITYTNQYALITDYIPYLSSYDETIIFVNPS